MRRIIAAVVIMATAGIAQGTVFTVDPDNANAEDSNPGTAAAPFATVQKAADVVQPGDTVRLKAGTYRQQFKVKTSGKVGAPITFEAAPGDEGKVLFTGNIPVTTATPTRTPHGVKHTIPYTRKYWILGKEEDRTIRDYVDQLFVDGELLKAVPEAGMLRPGRFWVDRKAPPPTLQFMLPKGKTLDTSRVEVSELQWAIRFDGATGHADSKHYEYVNFRGLSFFGYATNPRCAIVQFMNCRHMRLEDCRIRWTNCFGIAMSNSSYITLARNDIAHCGHLGVGGGSLDHITLEDNITNFCNYKRYSVWWECGGVKLCKITNSVIRRHMAIGNVGEGTWFDWDCSDNLVENCLLAYNVVTGHLNEVAPRNTYRNNIFAFNRVVQGQGLSVSGSSDVLAENNIFYGNEGAAIGMGGSPGKRAYGDDFVKDNNNRFVRNIMARNLFNIKMAGPMPKYCENNKSDYNLFWGWTGEQPMCLDGVPMDLDKWRETTGNDTHTIVADPLFVDPVGMNFTLKPGSPATRIGFDASKLKLDWSKDAPKMETAALRGGGREGETYFTVDLDKHVNRPLRDEVEGDGKGGWTDQGPNDMRRLPTGRQVLEGVPFQIGEGANGAIILKSGNVNLPAPDKVRIPVGRKAEALYLLHTVAWAPSSGDPLFKYVIRVGGKTIEVPIRGGMEILDWWSYVSWQEAEQLDTYGTFVAWQGANGLVGKVTVFAMRWVNPLPDEEIESIDFATVGDRAAVPILLAVTGVEKTDRAAPLRKAVREARLPSPNNVSVYIALDGDLVALTRNGVIEPEETAGSVVDVGPFVDGARGKGLHPTKRLTYENIVPCIDAREGTFSMWIKPDDWFSPKMLATYSKAAYRKNKVMFTTTSVRANVKSPSDPTRQVWAIECQALGTPADRKVRVGIIWNNRVRPFVEIARWPLVWHHIAVTWQTEPKGRGKARLFVDGKPVAEKPIPAALLPPRPLLMLGNAPHGGCLADAALDEVVIWDKVLPEEMIAQIWRSKK